MSLLKQGLAILFCSLAIFSNGQFLPLQTAIKHFFPEPEKGIWMFNYCGIKSNGDSIYLVRAYDNHSQRILIQFAGSQNNLIAECDFAESDSLQMIVTNESDERIGALFAVIRDSFMRVQLRRENLIEQFVVHLYNNQNWNANQCSSQNKIQIFKTNDNEWLKLQVHDDLAVQGEIIERHHLVYSFKGKCKSPVCDQVDIYFVNNELQGKQSQIQFTKADQITVSNCGILFDDHPKFQLKTNIPLECKYWKNNKHQIAIKYPSSEDKDFNKLIQEILLGWTNQVMNFSGPQSDVTFSYNYVDVDYYSDDIISGSFWFVEPWTKGTRAYPWSYDLKSGKLINIEDLFIKDVNYEDFMKSKKAELKDQLLFDSNSNAKSFFEQDPFNNITINPQGICLSSQNSPLYGIKKMILPYEVLNLQLKKNPLVKRIINY